MRPASREDLPAIVALLADDELGQSREIAGSSLPEHYLGAFGAIEADANNTVYVSELNGEVVSTMQRTLIANLSCAGGWRMQIEAVRVSRQHRGSGLGAPMIRWAIDQARERQCVLVQLSTDRRRSAALGFCRGHETLVVSVPGCMS